MVDKEGYIKYWVEGAEQSWESAQALINVRQYLMALFCWHLCIEKLLKAHWVKDNEGNFPPRTHNLLRLYEQTKLNLPEATQDEFEVINTWNTEGRYPEYNKAIYKTATKQYIESKKQVIEEIRLCLINKLP